MVKQLIQILGQIPRRLLVGVIVVYQQTLSPDHGPLRHLHSYGYCRHEPTCSQYGKQVIAERGVLIGIPLLLRRLLTCHPWAPVSKEKMEKLLSAKKTL